MFSFIVPFYLLLLVILALQADMVKSICKKVLRYNLSEKLAKFYPQTEFECQSGHCVPINSRCDLNVDCEDATDELDCGILDRWNKD